MSVFFSDYENLQQVLDQARVIAIRNPRAVAARGRRGAVGLGVGVGRGLGVGARAWLPSDLANSTNWVNPDQEVGAYNGRTGVFTPATSGTATHFKWVGSTNNTLMQTTGTNASTGLTLFNETFGGKGQQFRVLQTTVLANVRVNTAIGGNAESLTGENLFMAFVCKVSNFASKGFLKAQNFGGSKGYEAEFNSSGIPVFKFKNNTESETTESHTGSFGPTSGQYQVHVVQRFGNKLVWTIDGTKCIDVTTSYLGGTGTGSLHLFKSIAVNSEPDYGLAEFFKNNTSVTREIDRLKAEGYLAHKYSITLPRNHRYRKSAPSA